MCILALGLNGQVTDTTAVEDTMKYVKGPPKPEIGIGMGMLSVFGDIKDFEYGNPMVSRVAFEVIAKQRLNDWLGFQFHAMHGKIGINENSFSRNLNFQSKVTTGGISLVYEFDNLLPEDRKVSPFITAGFEAIEFHSKTDLYDAFGNKYHYWSDGSIRNIDENASNASEAVRIYRDYVYETDMREMNIDSFGKYPERTWGIPLSAGISFHLNKRMNFHFKSVLHIAFSDLIDNVTDQSGGSRIGDIPGNKRSDWLMYNGVTLTYDFTREVPERPEGGSGIDPLLAYDQDDFDGDGIIDWFDKCPQTPEGVEVDENGCPFDGDKDGVPNHGDEELETPDSLEVTPTGVGLTDEMIYDQYMTFNDSTGMYGVERVERKFSNAQKRHKMPKKRYVVKVGEYEGAIDDDMVDLLLSLPDVEMMTVRNKTIFTVGNYDNLPDAIKRKVQLNKDGIAAATVMVNDGTGDLKEVGDKQNDVVIEDPVTPATSDEPLFRVQIGAYSRKRSVNSFGEEGVLEIKSGGLYKYMTGSFKTFEDAKKHQDELRKNNYKDAFVVAYKGGDRVKLKSVGVNTSRNENIPERPEEEVDANKIRVMVQIGAYKNQLPTEVLSKFIKLENVDQKTLEGGLTRYTAGSFTSMKEAEAYLKKVREEVGLPAAFLIASHDGEPMSLEEAKKYLSE